VEDGGTAFLRHFETPIQDVLRKAERRTSSNFKVFYATVMFVSKRQIMIVCLERVFNLLTPNDDYSGRTAPLTSKRCILYIYSTNIGTEYFKNGINSPFFPLQNAVCFIILTYLVPVLFTFYIQCVLKLKKK